MDEPKKSPIPAEEDAHTAQPAVHAQKADGTKLWEVHLTEEVLADQKRICRVILMALGFIHLFLGFLIFIADYFLPTSAAAATILAASYMTFGLGLFFLALAVWARTNPLGSSVAALAIYGIFTLIDFASLYLYFYNSPTVARNGQFVTEYSDGFPIRAILSVIIRVIFVAALIKAVSAGLKYRETQLNSPKLPLAEKAGSSPRE